jgi:FMN phosphatase YigB (HAD superfamily)
MPIMNTSPPGTSHCPSSSSSSPKPVRAYKPHPLVFQRALEQLGLQSHEVLHVGDSDVDDVKGAKAAGLRVAWVNRDRRSRHPDAPQPDFEIPDLTRLLTLL